MASSERLSCPECGFSTSKEGKFVKHVRETHKKAALRCPFCDPVHFISSTDDLCAHKKLRHGQVRLRCFLCEFTSRSLKRWATHMTQSHLQEMPYMAVLASASDKVQYSPNILHENSFLTSVNGRDGGSEEEQEIKKISNDILYIKKRKIPEDLMSDAKRSFQHVEPSVENHGSSGSQLCKDKCSCDICSYSTSKRSHLAKHRGQEHPDTAVAKFDASLTQGNDMRKSGEEKYRCNVCNQCFRSSRKLMHHEKYFHLKNCLKCDKCSAVFKLVKHFKRHQMIHYNVDQYHCSVCNISFLNKHCYDDHQRVTHSKTKYQCPDCSKTYTTQRLMKQHYQAKHTDEAKHVCSYCGYSAFSAVDLIRHINTHTREKAFACDQCPFRAYSNSHLVQHMRIHTGEKPYSCHLCPFRSSTTARLTSHIRTHTNERPFKCKLCSAAFKVSNNLTVHQRIHTGEKPFMCERCFRHFRQSNHLKNHIKRGVCV